MKTSLGTAINNVIMLKIVGEDLSTYILDTTN